MARILDKEKYGNFEWNIVACFLIILHSLKNIIFSSGTMDLNKKFFVIAYLEILLQVENRLKSKPENTISSCWSRIKEIKTVKKGVLLFGS